MKIYCVNLCVNALLLIQYKLIDSAFVLELLYYLNFLGFDEDDPGDDRHHVIGIAFNPTESREWVVEKWHRLELRKLKN